MVDLEDLHEFATGLPDGADTLVREAIAELTHLRAKATELKYLDRALRDIADDVLGLTVPGQDVEILMHQVAKSAHDQRGMAEHLRTKAAAGAKLREALPVVKPRYCRECSADYALEEMNDAVREYDAAVGEGGG